MGSKKSKLPLVNDLEALLGQDRVLSHPTELLVYECDGLTLSKYGAEAVVLPRSTKEVSEIVKCWLFKSLCFKLFPSI